MRYQKSICSTLLSKALYKAYVLFNLNYILKMISSFTVTKVCGAEEDRTLDFLLAKQALYQTELRPLENNGPEGDRTTDLVLIRDAL